MIPLLDNFGKQKTQNGRLLWQKTEADEELKDCNGLCIDFMGKRYPLWKYVEMFCPIMDKHASRVPLQMNSAQRKLYRFMDEQFKKTGKVRTNIGKGRQMGSSTLVAALYWTWLITHPGFKVGILADTEAKGKGLLEKYRFFYLNSPEPLRSELKKACQVDNAECLSFDFGSGIVSSVMVIVANKNAGASYTFQALHCSEVALWEEISATLAALEQTVGNIDGTFIIRETTARGPNKWKRYYELGKTNKGLFRSIFLPWYLDTTYQAQYDGHPLTKYERGLQTIGLNVHQIQYWSQLYAGCGQDMVYMKHEYPSTEAEMWEGSGATYFDANIVARRKQEREFKYLHLGNFEYDEPRTDGTVDGRIWVDNPRFLWNEFGSVSIFEEPIEGHPYALACDPSEGGEDYTACHVIDCSNDRQVAVFHKTKVDHYDASYQCHCLATYFKNGSLDGKKNYDNRIYVTGERNSSRLWLRTMKRLGWEVRIDRSEDETGTYRNELGWRTTTSNRKAMIDEFANAFRMSLGTIVMDYETLCEMESFQWKFKNEEDHKGKAQAVGGAHDDLVMAYAGYFMCKGDFDCSIERKKTKTDEVFRFDPMSADKKKKSDRFQEW